MRIPLENATELIRKGEVIAVPTETVYGLAAALNNPKAVEKIFSIKGRPSNNPLIIHLAQISQLLPFLSIDYPKDLELLANRFWPGPLTIVLPINEETIPAKARANLATAAFRIPNHPLAQDLLRLTGPLVMPSANLSGKPSATSPEHVESDFGSDFPVLDGGPCKCGLESTILMNRAGKWFVIRMGAISPEKIAQVLGYSPSIDSGNHEGAPLCPGQLYRHYAPKAKLSLVTRIPINHDGNILGFTDRIYPKGMKVIPLGVSSNPEEVAENLYSALRFLDFKGFNSAFVDMDFPNSGLWATIAERLKKASQNQ
jgi:L-threonylcarbamoyladenylate synthase